LPSGPPRAYDRPGMLRAILLAWLVVVSPLARAAYAAPASVGGKLELPATLPERPKPVVKGFLDRSENQLAPVKPLSVTSQMIIVLEGDEKPVSPPQVVIELLGETFSRKVVAAPAGAEVVIKNLSKSARTLVAAEDPKLVPQGPINPTGPKSFRVADPGKVYNIGDKDAPHLTLRIVTINTPYYAYPDEAGRFNIENVPPGNYKLKVWYGTAWIERPDDVVEVGAKGKTEFNPKIAASAFQAPGAGGKK
jgi:hypothetical protein